MAAESAVRIIFLGDTASAVRSISRLESSFGGLGRTARLLTGALAIGMAGALGAATKQALDFQAAMDKIRGLVGESQKAVDAYSKAILKMNDVPQGPKELADALFFITSAGIHGAKAIDVLHTSAKAAGAGLGTTAVVADAVTSAMNAYADANLTAADASDTLVATVREGKTAADALAPALGRVIAPAHAAGVKFYEVGAAIAAMTRVGLSADESVTSLRGLLLAIEAPGGQAAKALKEIGTSGADMQKRITTDGLLSALEFLASHIKGNLAAGKALIPNVRALAGFLSAMGGNAKATEKIFADLENRTGSTDRAFQAASKGGLFQMHRAVADLQRAAIPLGNVVIPIFADLAGALSRVAIFMQKVADQKGIEAKFKAIAGAARVLVQDLRTELSHALFGFSEVIGTAAGARGGEQVGEQITKFHDGLVQKIQQQDWGMIGTKILAGITAGLKVGGQFAQTIVATLSDTIAQANWDQIARRAGPFIVAALASAISTALDPAFWIHHWDLALSIALVAFSDGIGRLAGRFAAPLVRLFAGMGARVSEALASSVLRIADRLPTRLQGVFLEAAIAAGRGLGRLVGIASSEIGKVASAISSKLAGLSGLFRFTLKVLGVDAALHAIIGFAQGAVAAISRAINWIINKIKSVAPAIAVGFVPAPITGFVLAVLGAIKIVEHLIGVIKSIPHDIAIHIHIPHVSLPHLPHVPGFATGGFIPGQRGEPKTILAHAGEVVLNRAQQAALGGAAFFKSMFGFRGEGPSFAAGGIVQHGLHRKKSGKSPHHPRGTRVHTHNALARRAIAAVDAVNQREDDTDRAYGQLVRFYDISQEQFIRTDDQGNDYVSQPDIDKRVAEIDDLIVHRNEMLDLLDTEKQKLAVAIKDLQAAIRAMLKAIREEHVAIRALAKRLSEERRKKKPNQKLIDSYQKQISTHGTRVGDLTNTISQFRSAIGDEQLNLVHQLPFDRRDVELDILTLQQERSDVTGTKLPPGGGGGGGAPPPSPVNDLLAHLRLALAVQAAQESIIGSFAKGTLSVPETGLAMVHAGEQIIPAGRSRDTASPSLPDIHLHVIVEDGAVNEDKIKAVAVAASDQISRRIGLSSSERLRSGRY